MAKRILEGHEGKVKCVAISGDSKLIASGSDDETIKLWRVGHKTVELVHTITGHDAYDMCLDLNRDGTLLVSKSHRKNMTIWGLHAEGAPTMLHTLSQHAKAVNAVKISPDGHKIASASADTTVMIWSAQTGERLLTFTGHESEVLCLAWSSDSKLVASGGRTELLKGGVCDSLFVWDASTGQQVMKPLKGHDFDVTCLAFSSKTTFLVGACSDIFIWSLFDGKRKKLVCSPSELVKAIALSPNDRYIVANGNYGWALNIWDLTNRCRLGTLLGHVYHVNSMAWSPNGRFIASASDDRTLRFWRGDQVQLTKTPWKFP